jgi:DNA-binding SARP family transcriptional activator
MDPLTEARSEAATGSDPVLLLLQQFELRAGGTVVALPRVVQRLVAFLALVDRPDSRLHAAVALWPAADERHACANLRSTLWRVGRARLPLLSIGASSLALHPSVIVDVRNARILASQVFDRSVDSSTLKPDPTPAFVEDLLPGWYEDWVVVERERFRQVRLHALEALCDRFVESGRLLQAIEAGLSAVAADPLRESAHRALIRAYVKEGNLSEAVHQYDRCRRILVDELGIEPSETLSDELEGAAR